MTRHMLPACDELPENVVLAMQSLLLAVVFMPDIELEAHQNRWVSFGSGLGQSTLVAIILLHCAHICHAYGPQASLHFFPPEKRKARSNFFRSSELRTEKGECANKKERWHTLEINGTAAHCFFHNMRYTNGIQH